MHIFSYYSGNGTFKIIKQEIHSEHLFYTDTYYYCFLLVLTVIAFLFFYNKYSPKDYSKKWLCALYLIGLILLVNYPLYNNYIIRGNDMGYHLTRIEGIKDGLLARQFPVILFPNTMRGYTYLNTMYPCLFLYLPALLRIVGVSLVTSYKTLLFCINAATAIVSFYSVKKISKSDKSAILMATFYTFSYYRLTCTYQRAAIGEALAMIFLPLILLGMYQVIFDDKKKWLTLVIGFTGVIQSHVLSAEMMIIICSVLGCVFIRQLFREHRWFELIKGAAVTVLLNLWFVIPFLDYFKTDIKLSQLQWSYIYDRQIALQRLFQTTSMDIVEKDRLVSLGVPLLSAVFLAILYWVIEYNKESRKDQYIQVLLIIGFLSSLMVTDIFPWKELFHIKIVNLVFSNMQFAWRFLSFAGVSLAFASSIWIVQLKALKSYHKGILLALLSFCILSSITILDGYANAKSIMDRCESIAGNRNPREYLITGTSKGRNHLPKSPVVSDKNAIQILSYTKKNTTVAVTYQAIEDGQFIEIPIFSYKHYEATDENGSPLSIETGKNNRIKIWVHQSDSVQKINISYKKPIFYSIALWTSIVTLFILIYIRRNKTFMKWLPLRF